MLFRLQDYEIDTAAFELRRAGDVIATEPLVFDLIQFFAENPGRLVSRDEVIENVWNGRIVSEATISGCIKAARKALGDSGTEQKYIKTIRGRGFQFTSDVTSETFAEVPPKQSDIPVARRTLPVLAVLPFDSFGDDGTLGPLADGLVENLTTALVRVPLLSLVSRTSSFTLKGAGLDAQSVGQRLGADLMLEGSLQSTADHLRINLQLIETDRGLHLWAQSFDVPHGPQAIDDMLYAVLPRLEAQLSRAIFNGLAGRDGDLTPHQLLLRAISLLSIKGWHRDTFEEAADILRQVVAAEPDLALAHAHLSLILGLGHRVGLLERSSAVVKEVVQEAEAALRLDNLDSVSVALAACALADVGQAARAVPLLEHAIELNSNNGHAWAALGSAHLMLGHPKPAIDNLKTSVSISPLDARLSIWHSVLALAHLRDEDLPAATIAAQHGCQADDRAYIPRVVLGAVRLAANDPENAALAMADALRAKPDLSPNEISSLVGRDIGSALGQIAHSPK